MARKRLNKKVALIGSTVFLLLMLSIVAVILLVSGDPEKFIQDGEAAWLAKDYKSAERSFLKAHKSAKSDEQKKDILFRLSELFIETDQWPKVRGCWEQIVNIDSEDVKARLARLKYLYIVADSYANTGLSVGTVWKEVQSQASELIEVVEAKNIIEQDRTQWEQSFGPAEGKTIPPGGQLMGSHLYLLRGRSAYELAKMGAVTVPEELLDQATDDLKKVLELEPNNVHAYHYLALTEIERGEIFASRGNLERKDEAAQQAEEFLVQAVEIADYDPRAHINLANRKLELARKGNRSEQQQQVRRLEPEYLTLTDKFPSSAEAFAALAGFYSVYSVFAHGQLGLDNLDKAIGAIQKAMELDQHNVTYAADAARLHYRRFSVYDKKQEVHKAIAIAKDALSFPDVEDTTGPRNHANKVNRFMLYSLLANCYIEQLLEPWQIEAESNKQLLLADAERAVHEIEQIFGSGEDPRVIKWQGMLELAKGNRGVAIKKLYAAYEQIKASKPRGNRDAQLCYTLANLFKNTSELGAVVEFLINALESGIEFTKPKAILDYLEALGRLDMWSHVLSPANQYSVDAYEESFGTSQRSRAIRVRALIGTNRVSEAEEELAKYDPDDPNTIRLSLELMHAQIKHLLVTIGQRQIKEDSGFVIDMEQVQETKPDESLELMRSELEKYGRHRDKLVQKLLSADPSLVSEDSIATVCRDYIVQGRSGEAKELVNQFLEQFPDNTAILLQKRLLSESDPANVSQQRRGELEQQVLSNISDPLRRSLRLGTFYKSRNDSTKAIRFLKEALETDIGIDVSIQGQGPEQVQESKIELHAFAANHLFDIACDTKDWPLAEQVLAVAQHENLDECHGLAFAAHLAAAKGEYEEALSRIDECLRQRPIFSRAYLLRSSLHLALGDENAAIEDIRKAAYFNPMDVVIAKGLANTLYLRNRKLGNSASSEEILEAKRALERAIRLNPRDVVLLSAYAEFISIAEPLKALAIRQTIQKNAPSLQNAVLLGKLATRLATEKEDTRKKESFFAIAASALEQARAIDPNDPMMLATYAEYYRASGQDQKAQELLTASEDSRLLWRHYVSLGRFEQAKKVLEQSYKLQPKDKDVVSGLLLVAKKTGDKEGVARYSEELLSFEDNAQVRLEQIEAMISVGLIKDAERKLQSFMEKYPNEPRALAVQGWLAMRQGQIPKALELMNRSLEEYPDNAAAWRLRGEINILGANYEQAIVDLKKSKVLSESSETNMSLARAYLQAGRVEDAIIELKNIIDDPIVATKAMLLLEQIYLKLDRNEALKQLYEDALVKFPSDAMWYNRAAAYALQQRQLDKAEQLYEKAYTLKRQEYQETDVESAMRDTQYVRALDGYLHTLVKAAGASNVTGGPAHPEKLDKVFDVCKHYEDTVFAPIVLFRMAEAKLKLGDKDTAVNYCRKAVNEAGANEELASQVLLGMFLLLGEEEVSAYCEEMLRADSNSVLANFTMFNLARIKRQYDKATEYINRCIQIVGADSSDGIGYIMKKVQMLAFAYKKTSDNSYLKQTIPDYQSLLDKMPNNTFVMNNLAYVLAESDQRLTEALEYARQAVEQKPDNPNFLDTYGYVLYKNGRESEAFEFIAASLQQYQQSEIAVPAEVYMHLGMIKETLGEKKPALDAYKRALEIGVDEFSDTVKDRINSAIERLSE